MLDPGIAIRRLCFRVVPEATYFSKVVALRAQLLYIQLMASFALNPLFYARAAAKMSLATLAAAVGCTKGQLSRIERLETKASPELAEKLADCFNGKVTRDQILFPHRYVEKKKPVRSMPTKKPSARATAGSVAAHG